MNSPVDRQRLRREMRARRRALSFDDVRRAARSLGQVANRWRLLRQGLHIAVYFSHANEADLTVIIATARQRGCVLYLPVITNYQRSRMQFCRFDPAERLQPNRFGILEPARIAGVIAIRRLDLVLTPLVAFDDRGRRLGSGAGFYDRALHHLRAGRKWRRPRLIGVGYEFQRVRELDPAPWDVPLDAVLTEKSLYPTQHLKGTP